MMNNTPTEVLLIYFYSSLKEETLRIKEELEHLFMDNGGEEFLISLDLNTMKDDDIRKYNVFVAPTVIIYKDGKEFVRQYNGISAKKCAKLFIDAFKY